MEESDMLKSLLRKNDARIVFLVMDGVGGIRNRDFPKTALESAKTPNLDMIASESACGRITPISAGMTPGSGPAHFSLFGYDPFLPENDAGRGVIEVTGVGFELKSSDIAIRGNFATIDEKGILTDRRAGRIPHEEGERICEKLGAKIKKIDDVEIIIMPVREYRFGIVLRGKGLSPLIEETDPQVTGRRPLDPAATAPEGARTASILTRLVKMINEVLIDEKKANTALLRGISQKPSIEPFNERYGLKAAAVAAYPLYRGVARLCGMDLFDTGFTPAEEFETVRSIYGGDHDFFFIHIKKTDSYGEDGNIEGKVKVIEEVDAAIPLLMGIDPDVLIVTGDHSTPCAMKGHSWHPVPFMIRSKFCGIDASRGFSETECDKGSLGVFPALSIMELALANAGKLKKYGA
ncbi:MAG: 2,3-bisphosphoglycerate-independent phosphoglycerate mutase [Candidatus Krumholzibacteriota bacterium]|nr:2,3-bisphosphoglycerate-independent phosphoglycerate mutase [Candidatus Krumholzibacteriota bacterium]